MRKLSDPVIVGAISGTIACVIKEAGTRPLIPHIMRHDGIEKAAAMVIPAYEVRTPVGRVVGLLADASMGSMLATLMASLHRSGSLKVNAVNGSLIGLGCWTVLYGGLGELSHGIPRASPVEAVLSAGWHIIYGAIAGSLVSILGEDGSARRKQISDQLNEKIQASSESSPLQNKVAATDSPFV